MISVILNEALGTWRIRILIACNALRLCAYRVGSSPDWMMTPLHVWSICIGSGGDESLDGVRYSPQLLYTSLLHQRGVVKGWNNEGYCMRARGSTSSACE